MHTSIELRTFVLVLSLLPLSQVPAAGSPQVLGYGVKQCQAYLDTYAGWQRDDQASISEYHRFRGWLAGLVSGLSLATGVDVLNGIEVKRAMRRIQLNCEEQPRQDFFNASMQLIRLLDALDSRDIDPDQPE